MSKEGKGGHKARDLGTAMLVALVEMMGDCLNHPHEQVERCVYCVPCKRRLYQGRLFDASDIAGLNELRAMMKEERY